MSPRHPHSVNGRGPLQVQGPLTSYSRGHCAVVLSHSQHGNLLRPAIVHVHLLSTSPCGFGTVHDSVRRNCIASELNGGLVGWVERHKIELHVSYRYSLSIITFHLISESFLSNLFCLLVPLTGHWPMETNWIRKKFNHLKYTVLAKGFYSFLPSMFSPQ